MYLVLSAVITSSNCGVKTHLKLPREAAVLDVFSLNHPAIMSPTYLLISKPSNMKSGSY